MIDKGLCNKGFIWNPSNCECYCDKSCDIGEYLDYEKCKCRKKIFDKLMYWSIDEVEIAGENEHKNKCSSCTLYVVFFSIFFTSSIGIAIYFAYIYSYLKKDDARAMLDTRNETTIYWNLYKMEKVKKINIKNWGYYFCDDMINIKNFNSNLLKIDKKLHEDIDIYYISYIMLKKCSDCENNHNVNLLYLIIHSATGNFKEKYGEKYFIIDSTEEYEEIFLELN